MISSEIFPNHSDSASTMLMTNDRNQMKLVRIRRGIFGLMQLGVPGALLASSTSVPQGLRIFWGCCRPIFLFCFPSWISLISGKPSPNGHQLTILLSQHKAFLFPLVPTKVLDTKWPALIHVIVLKIPQPGPVVIWNTSQLGLYHGLPSGNEVRSYWAV